MEIIFVLAIFLFSVVIHEVSHGFAAEKLGDPTARLQGRLTLNPIKHIDPIGSVLLPLILALSPAKMIFGWAKPVPFDPRNLKNPKTDAGMIAAIGPATNFLIAVLFAGIFRAFIILLPQYAELLALPFAYIIQINLLLAIFNLLPIPPLDGSKILFALLPNREAVYQAMLKLEEYGFVILILLLFTGALNFIYPLVNFAMNLLVGG